VTTRRAVGLSVLHFSVVRVRNNPSRFVTCMRACVQRHRWARRTGGGDPTVGGSGVEGDARSVKPYRHRRRPWFLPRIPTPIRQPHRPTPPPHHLDKARRRRRCRRRQRAPFICQRAPSRGVRVRVRACVRMHVAHAAAP